MKIENLKIEAIKNYLKDNKITYIQLSERCGIPVGTLRNIFSGVIKNPRLDTIQKIESALSFEDEKTLAREYLTEQEEQLLSLFKSLSKRGKNLALEWMHALELYENG